MAGLALALFVLYLALAVGARALLQKLRIGSSDFRASAGAPVRWGGSGRCCSPVSSGPASQHLYWT